VGVREHRTDAGAHAARARGAGPRHRAQRGGAVRLPGGGRGDLPAELGRTDVLVVILPSTPDTANALDGDRLAALPSHAYVVNVGRGATVDESALVAALVDGRIAGAALDVTAVEPLPADSPLWEAPHLVLTPHAAGGRPVGADGLLSHNLAALLEGEELRNVVER
jgi:phosphoglycerate dehydrogenase-like enzyme